MNFSILSVTVASVLVLAFAGCASASDPPLGGPYGGTANDTTTSSTSPTDPGTTSSASSGGSGTASSTSASSSSTSSSSGSSGTSTSSASSTSGSTTSSTSSSSSSGSSGSSSGSSGSSGTTAPTWTSIQSTYLATGTIGNCAKSGCHSQMSTPSGAYTWLKGKGYMSATNAGLADPAQSCLSWLGGSMPPGGPSSNAAATSDLTAWAAAGAPNN